MKSEHRVSLETRWLPVPTLTRDWGLSCITAVYDHILYGPETLVVRSSSLTAVMGARSRVLAEMPKAARNEANGRWLKCS